MGRMTELKRFGMFRKETAAPKWRFHEDGIIDIKVLKLLNHSAYQIITINLI